MHAMCNGVLAEVIHTGHGVGRIVVVIGTIIVRRMRTSERTYEPRMRAYVRRRGRPTPCAVA